MFKFLSFSVLLLASVVFSQPSWLSASRPAPHPPAASSSSVGGGGKPSVVYRDRVKEVVKYDTITITKTDTIRDTVPVAPTQYKYVIRYALCDLNVTTDNLGWLDYSSTAEIVARDTATLRVGSEDLRTLGHIVDQFGNRLPQTEIITTGFTIQVTGDRVSIEYRGKTNIALFSGSFDNEGYLIATGEISESGFLSSFFPFSLFFNVQRKKIIIEIIREVRE